MLELSSSLVNLKSIDSDRSNYYLQAALSNELKLNIKELDEYINMLEQSNDELRDESPPFFNTLIWRASERSKLRFDIPSSVMPAIAEFNAKTTDVINGRIRREVSRDDIVKILMVQRDKARDEILPDLERSRDVFHRRLKRYDVDLH